MVDRSRSQHPVYQYVRLPNWFYSTSIFCLTDFTQPQYSALVQTDPASYSLLAQALHCPTQHLMPTPPLSLSSLSLSSPSIPLISCTSVHCLVLDCRAEARCRHYKIEITRSNKYVISGEPKVHSTLSDLVDCHKTVSLHAPRAVVTQIKSV